MNYCLTALQKCCTSLSLCCHRSCQSISKCCDQTCGKCCDQGCTALCECLTKCCESIQKVFTLPFSLCTFLSLFLLGVPFVLMLTILGSDHFTFSSDQPIATFLLVTSIGNLINLMFCVYLVCSFKQGYQHRINMVTREKVEENNVCDKVKNLILYDCVVFLYLILSFGLFIYCIIGSTYFNDPLCRTTNLMCSYASLNRTAMLLFYGLGLICFLMSIAIKGCEEGSCTAEDYCANICLVLTCCICDCRQDVNKRKIRRQQKEQSRLQQRLPINNQPMDQPQQQRPAQPPARPQGVLSHLFNAIFTGPKRQAQQMNEHNIQHQQQQQMIHEQQQYNRQQVNQQLNQQQMNVPPMIIQQQAGYDYPLVNQGVPVQDALGQAEQGQQYIQIQQVQLHPQEPAKIDKKEKKPIIKGIKDKLGGLFSKKG